MTLDDDNLKRLKRHIKNFKKEVVQIFKDVQCSGMGTVKSHVLSHTCEEKYRLGALHINLDGPAEHKNSIIKRVYRQTSK